MVPDHRSGRRLALAAGSMLDADAFAGAEAAAAAGFDAVGLRLSDQHDGAPAGLARLGEHVAALGLAVHDVEVHRITAERPDPGPLADAAAAVGARHLLVVSDVPDEALTRAEVERAVRRAGAVGVRVAVEYMAWTTPAAPGPARRLALDSGCVVVADLLHHVRVGAGPGALADLAGAGVLGWVQVCDAPGPAPADLVHEARHARLVPGEGALPLDGLLGVVPADVVWSVEVQSDTLARAVPLPERAQRLLAAARRLDAQAKRTG